MDQDERLVYLIEYLMGERDEYRRLSIPEEKEDRRRLLRSLMNVRPPDPVSDDFLKVQDEYLRQRLEERGVTTVAQLTPVRRHIYLWQGDITTLKADAIVNAANSGMLGCFVPCHGCIDNAIHTYAGVQLRMECRRLMEKQGDPEPAGQARITGGYNLPAAHVIHTVGPVVRGSVTEKDREMLRACYRSCLELADKSGLKSIAFCCVSTGEFHFPNEEAARIAVETVTGYLDEKDVEMEVIFNVFKDEDLEIYRRLLAE
ncbi:protein-ADP-ribose hydrolase [Gallibacter sp. Marseille-QA0791]|uniref:protein-ADP-ribose hydrolase n=1 Tax=Gallibacter sp. Marseille-QA0791 TaxID=3378781 RepID=UPI003D0E99FB